MLYSNHLIQREVTLIYNVIKDLDFSLAKEIKDINRQLRKLPEGRLFATKTGHGTKWYLKKGSKKTYLPKKERNLAIKLAKKRYLETKLELLEKKRVATEIFLRHYPRDESTLEKLFSDTSGYRELLINDFLPLDEDLKTWQHAPYDRSQEYPEDLNVKSAAGYWVRSKSEGFITMALLNHKIPHHYEEKLNLDGIILYPDFTIRHPITGEYFYWEHFGIMDSPSYVQTFKKKIQTYTDNGIYPQVNLIMTFETNDHPLDINLVEQIIKTYFEDCLF